MTGYGQASEELPEGRLSVEVRSLNHRFADLRLRLPAEAGSLESRVRKKVLACVRRGRVELAARVVPATGTESTPFNRALAEDVLAAGRVLRDELGVRGEPDVAAVLAVPGMFRAPVAEPAWDELHRDALDCAVDGALRALDSERKREGDCLRDAILERLAAMDGLVAELGKLTAAIPATLRERLLERLRALSSDVTLDPARVAQEATILADRADVSEEMVRLTSHLAQVRALLARDVDEPVGKRLEFLVQEIHRETNTINSKSQDLDVTRGALGLKAEIEKVREQIQNVE